MQTALNKGNVKLNFPSKSQNFNESLLEKEKLHSYL